MSIRDSYNAWAATYDSDRNLTRDLDQQVTQALLGDAHYASILELGCGTGKNTAVLARRAAQVHALDFSEAMINQARTRLRHAGNVTFTVADLTQRWPRADRSVDLIVCNLVLEHIADLSPIFTEAARVLPDRGRFFISELHPFRQYQGAQAHFQRGATRIAIPAFVHHISDYLRAAESAGFALSSLREWWHDDDQHNLPRLVSFMFEQRALADAYGVAADRLRDRS